VSAGGLCPGLVRLHAARGRGGDLELLSVIAHRSPLDHRGQVLGTASESLALGGVVGAPEAVAMQSTHAAAEGAGISTCSGGGVRWHAADEDFEIVRASSRLDSPSAPDGTRIGTASERRRWSSSIRS
jgi:hypothetical protein